MKKYLEHIPRKKKTDDTSTQFIARGPMELKHKLVKAQQQIKMLHPDLNVSLNSMMIAALEAFVKEFND